MKQAKHATRSCKAAYSGRTVPDFHRSSLFTHSRNCEKGSPQTFRDFTELLDSVNPAQNKVARWLLISFGNWVATNGG